MDIRTQKNEKVSPDEWYTPKWIIDRLGPFDLDPCSPLQRPYDTARVHYSKADDGLLLPWQGCVWLNPPYSRVLLRRFVEKLADHGDGIALLVNRTDNLLFHEVIFPRASSLLFMRHRVHFLRPDGSSGNPFFGSVLIAFGDACSERLRLCGIEGKFVEIYSDVKNGKE